MVNEISSKLFDYEARAILDEIVSQAEDYFEVFKETLPLNEVTLHK
jgi:chromosome segregation ATPase